MAKPTLIGRFPLGKQAAVVQLEPCRLLGEIDVDNRTGEEGGNDESKMSYKHVLAPLDRRVNLAQSRRFRSLL